MIVCSDASEILDSQFNKLCEGTHPALAFAWYSGDCVDADACGAGDDAAMIQVSSFDGEGDDTLPIDSGSGNNHDRVTFGHFVHRVRQSIPSDLKPVELREETWSDMIFYLTKFIAEEMSARSKSFAEYGQRTTHLECAVHVSTVMVQALITPITTAIGTGLIEEGTHGAAFTEMLESLEDNSELIGWEKLLSAWQEQIVQL